MYRQCAILIAAYCRVCKSSAQARLQGAGVGGEVIGAGTFDSGACWHRVWSQGRQEPRRVSAHCDVVDDLLWQAVAGRLPGLGSIALARSGRIGPLVELAMAAAASPDVYHAVSVEPPVFQQVTRALRDGAKEANVSAELQLACPFDPQRLEDSEIDRMKTQRVIS